MKTQKFKPNFYSRYNVAQYIRHKITQELKLYGKSVQNYQQSKYKITKKVDIYKLTDLQILPCCVPDSKEA